jgi:hypothetical protein
MECFDIRFLFALVVRILLRRERVVKWWDLASVAESKWRLGDAKCLESTT